MSRVAKTRAEMRVSVKGASKRGGVKKSTINKKAGEGGNISDNTQADIFISYNSDDDKNILAIIELVRRGISTKHFKRIVDDGPFSLAEWASYLHLSERTIQRNQKEMKPFQPTQSERIVELAMLYKYGVEVFGDKNNFNTWLLSKSIALGGRTPKELLDTKFGISMVKDELGRIEHGVLA